MSEEGVYGRFTWIDTPVYSHLLYVIYIPEQLTNQ